MSSSSLSKESSRTTQPKLLAEHLIPHFDPPPYHIYDMDESRHEAIELERRPPQTNPTAPDVEILAGHASKKSVWTKMLMGTKIKMETRYLQLVILLLAFGTLLGFHAGHYGFDTPTTIKTMCEDKSRQLFLLDLAFPSACGYGAAVLYYIYDITKSEQNRTLDFFVVYWIRVLGATSIPYIFGILFNPTGVYHCKLLNMGMNNTLKGWEGTGWS